MKKILLTLFLFSQGTYATESCVCTVERERIVVISKKVEILQAKGQINSIKVFGLVSALSGVQDYIDMTGTSCATVSKYIDNIEKSYKIY